jgi:hypothetical protein
MELSGTEATIVAVVIFVAQAIGKLIPDTAGGLLGVVRKIAKIVGLYVPNRTS